MEQTHDLGLHHGASWMSMKRKHNSVWRSSVHWDQRPADAAAETWEEQAFAEDAAGPLGGCIWPPRSYSCSFCRREFGSAQALGGHMNVHRRDRVRLQQALRTTTPQTSSTEEPAAQIHRQDQKPQIPYSSSGSTLQGYAERWLGSDMPPRSDYLKPHEDCGYQSGFSTHDRIVVRKKPNISTAVLGLLPVPLPRVLRVDNDDDGVSGGSLEELDLELRLGDPPKVK